jgi:thioredoxin reductase
MADEEYDVVVVGSGENGMAAALTARRTGLRAVVVNGWARPSSSWTTPGGGRRSR